jgi:hypothetical protein
MTKINSIEEIINGLTMRNVLTWIPPEALLLEPDFDFGAQKQPIGSVPNQARLSATIQKALNPTKAMEKAFDEISKDASLKPFRNGK